MTTDEQIYHHKYLSFGKKCDDHNIRRFELESNIYRLLYMFTHPGTHIDCHGTKLRIAMTLSDTWLHCLDKPAVEHADGTILWYKKDELHRIDGPAITWPDGEENWCWNNMYHRMDGPAIIRPNGEVEWWVRDRKFKTVDTWAKRIGKRLSSEDYTMLKLKHG